MGRLHVELYGAECFFGVLCVGLICDEKAVVINTFRQKHFSEDSWVRKDFFSVYIVSCMRVVWFRVEMYCNKHLG